MDKQANAFDELEKGVCTYVDYKISKANFIKQDIGIVQTVTEVGGKFLHKVKVRGYDYEGIMSVGNNKFDVNSVVFILIPNGQYNNMFILGHLDDTEANIKGGTISIGNSKFVVNSDGSLNINNKFKVDSSGNLNINNVFKVDSNGKVTTTSGNLGKFLIDAEGLKIVDTDGQTIIGGVYPSSTGGMGGLALNGASVDMHFSRVFSIADDDEYNYIVKFQMQDTDIVSIAPYGWVQSRANLISMVNGTGTQNYFRTGSYAGSLETRSFLTFYTPNGTVSSSDGRLKKDISKLNKEDTANFIYSLKPSEYRYKENDSNRLHHGFIAQEVKESMGGDDWGVYIEQKDDDKTKGLRYEEFIADIVATLQYQKELIDKQQDEIDKLKEIIKRGEDDAN